MALITGSGSNSGIGFSTAVFLARMGATVFLTGASERVNDRASELRADGFEAFSEVADLTDEIQVSNLVGKIISTVGRLDIVVNNAGMTSVAEPMESSGESGSVSELTKTKWEASLNRNVTTAFLVTKYSLEHLRKSGHGRIVSVSSVTGPVMAMNNDAAYAAGKAAMVGLTRAIAIDEANYGITANAVAPGWIETESQTENEARQGELVPAGRSATPSEVAACIGFLASTEAAYVTGQVLVVDGGNSIHEERATKI